MKQFTYTSEQKYYLCDYWYEGDQWSIEIPADSWEEAQKRLRSISQGTIIGELQVTLPYSLGWAAKLWITIRSLLT